MRRPGHGVRDAAEKFEPDSRSGSALVRQRVGAGGQVGLAVVHVRHVAAQVAEAAAELVFQEVVADQIDPGGAGQALAREVVLGRAETAGQQHRIGARKRSAQRLGDGVDVVADHAAVRHRDADIGQLASELGRVAVEDVAVEQLVADGEKFSAHRRPCAWRVPYRRNRPRSAGPRPPLPRG